MRLTALFALLALLLLCASPTIAEESTTQEHRSIILIVLDGVGAHYVMDGLTPTSLSGEVLKKAQTPPYLAHMHAYTAHTSVPETGPAHAVLFTGCSRAEPETVGFDGATIFDVVRAEGYGVYAIMQQGDAQYVRAEQDAMLYFARGLSVDDVRVVWSEDAKAVGSVMEDCTLAQPEGEDARWLVQCALEVINTSDEPYLLTMNIATCDHSAHAGNLSTYITATEEALDMLEPLVSECTMRGDVVAITSDHGMAFWSARSKGGHASSDYAASPEATTCILYLNDQAPSEVMSQQDIVPALLQLAGISRMPRYANMTPMWDEYLEHEHLEPQSVPEWRIWAGAIMIAAINAVGIVLLRRLS
ncbi:MAG: hypothetical protein ACXQS4_01735 [Methermicoccaceae archaeon]